MAAFTGSHSRLRDRGELPLSALGAESESSRPRLSGAVLGTIETGHLVKKQSPKVSELVEVVFLPDKSCISRRTSFDSHRTAQQMWRPA